jgi:flagellar protein FliS
MFYNNHARQDYLENEVSLADPLQLVRMMYRGAIDAVAAARKSLAAGDIAARSRQITKATSILNELALGLDHNRGGEISRSLAELYDYMARRLNEANFKQIEEPLAEVSGLLTSLAEAWETCEAAARSVEHLPAAAEYHPVSCMA